MGAHCPRRELTNVHERVATLGDKEDWLPSAPCLQDLSSGYEHSEQHFVCQSIPGDIPRNTLGWPDVGWSLVKFDTDVFRVIERMVVESLPGFEVAMVKNIWNRSLWKHFMDKQARLEAASIGDPQIRLLFHGSDHDTLQKIIGVDIDSGLNDSGFDPRLSGKGEYSEPHCATYFSQYAVYPVKIHPRVSDVSSSELFKLLLSEVLCGRSYNCGAECKRFLRPPPHAAGGLYDSVVGTENGIGKKAGFHWYSGSRPGESPEEFGKQYVLFERDAAYPHFIVSVRELHVEMGALTEFKDSPRSVVNFLEHGQQVALKTWNGRYICARQDGCVTIASVQREWELFTEEAIDGGIRLKTAHGTWLSCLPCGQLAQVKHCTRSELFTKMITPASQHGVLLVSHAHVPKVTCLIVR